MLEANFECRSVGVVLFGGRLLSSPKPFFGVDNGAPGTYGSLTSIAFTAQGGISGNRFINQEKNGIDGAAPTPNSRHIGIIVAAFCDGTVRTITENISRDVYTRLITSGAARPRTIAGWGAEAPLGGNEF